MDVRSLSELEVTGARSNFGCTWDILQFPDSDTSLTLQTAQNIRYTEQEPVGYATGLLAHLLSECTPSDTPYIGAQLEHNHLFTRKKDTENPRRNWVYMSVAHKLVVKYGGNTDENRMQFEYLTYLGYALADSSIVVPQQFALIENDTMSAIVMQHIAGEALSRRSNTERTRVLSQLFAIVRDRTGSDAAVDLMNDVGVNKHFNNIRAPRRVGGRFGLIDVPNMGTEQEVLSVHAAAERLNQDIGKSALIHGAVDSVLT